MTGVFKLLSCKSQNLELVHELLLPWEVGLWGRGK